MELLSQLLHSGGSRQLRTSTFHRVNDADRGALTEPPGAGHYPSFERPEPLQADMPAFLQALPSLGGGRQAALGEGAA